MDPERRRSLARAFLGFLPIEDRGRNPTYWAICRGIAESGALLALADEVPPPQYAPNVLLAAVHDVLLDGAHHELAAHYRSVAQRRGLEFRPLDDRATVELFSDLCRRERDAVLERCRTRTTQTNEVGRSAVLRAALASLGTQRPLALVELGCSAGLNLFVDAYGCDYGSRRVKGQDGAPDLRCELVGAEPPLELAPVARRIGLDRDPVEVTTPGSVQWLLACLWPDDLERFDRLEAAAALARRRRDEVELLRGDMVEGVAGAIGRCTDDERVVVFTTWAATYLPPPARAALAEQVRRAAEGRDLAWVVMEFPTVARDLGVLPADVDPSRRAGTVVCVTRYEGARPSSSLVAECHPHGRWLDWR